MVEPASSWPTIGIWSGLSATGIQAGFDVEDIEWPILFRIRLS